jgi:hypothetical protein
VLGEQVVKMLDQVRGSGGEMMMRKVAGMYREVVDGIREEGLVPVGEMGGYEEVLGRLERGAGR